MAQLRVEAGGAHELCCPCRGAVGVRSLTLCVTCIASLFLAAVGATLVVTARQRNEGSTVVLRATLIAAIPGMLLLALMLYGFVNAML